MDAEKLFEIVKRRPFEPMRVHLSDGKHYEVRHPEQLLVSRRWSYVGLNGGGSGPFQDTAIIDNVHVSRIEPISSGN